jgi:hypothetical protein
VVEKRDCCPFDDRELWFLDRVGRTVGGSAGVERDPVGPSEQR